MTTIRIMLIIMIMSSLIHNNARAMEKTTHALLPAELIPIEFFMVRNNHEFKTHVPFGTGAGPDSNLFLYRISTYQDTTTTLADVKKCYAATEKINSTILKELGYSEDDLKKYTIRAENRFNALQTAMHLKLSATTNLDPNNFDLLYK